MTRTLEYVFAYQTPGAVLCQRCGSSMVTKVDGGRLRAWCLARHCAQYKLIGEAELPAVDLLVVGESPEDDDSAKIVSTESASVRVIE